MDKSPGSDRRGFFAAGDTPGAGLAAGWDGGKAKNEEDLTATKKTQKGLQIRTIEEKRQRKYNIFKPPTSSDFHNAAEIFQTSLIYFEFIQ